MPDSPMRPCTHPGCGQLTKRGRCSAHRRQYEQQRGSAAKRMYGRTWQRARELYLAEHPFCEHCQAEGKLVPSMELDHIEPHRGDPVVFWRRGNWQALCKTCHSRKTLSEQG